MIAKTFQLLLSRIQPLSTELSQAGSHAASIKQRLQTSFDLKNFLIVGSHDRETAIRGSSDVDALALFSRDEWRWGGQLVSSGTMLNRLRTDLGDRFKQTSIGRDGQVVRVSFGQGAYGVDVIPAFYVEQHAKGWPIYGIPDGNGGWMRTAPTLHTRYLKEANEAARGKLRTVSQLLKYWTQLRSTTQDMSSFHLEMLLASEQLCVGALSYSAILTTAFVRLAERQCAALRDPVGVAGLIPCIASPSKRAIAITAVSSATQHARASLYAEQRGDAREVYRQWDIVFNHTLPA